MPLMCDAENTSRFLQLLEKVVVDSDNRLKHINMLCCQNGDVLNVRVSALKD